MYAIRSYYDRHLADDAGPEARQPLIDECRQHGVAGGDAEQRGNAEIADGRHEGKRAAGDQRRRGGSLMICTGFRSYNFV